MVQWVGDRLELTFETVHELDVDVVGGEVTVAAGAGPARVEVEVLDGPEVEVMFSAGRLQIVHSPLATLLGRMLGRVRVHVSVVVPEGTPTTIRTVSADVFAAGLRATTTVATTSGELTATALDGHVALRSVSGDIDVQEIGGTVRLATVSGSVTLAASDPASVSAKTVSGEVTLDLLTVPELGCTSVSGDIALRLPAGSSLDLDVATVSGHLDTSFPAGGVDVGRRRMRGPIGSGGTPVSLRTTSGDVAVLQAEPVSTSSTGLAPGPERQ